MGNINKKKLFWKLELLVMSGGPEKISFSKEEILFLKKSVKMPIKLYRGIHIMRFRVDEKLWKQIDDLREGDTLPRFLQKSHVYNPYASYTRKKSIANYYAKEGHVSIVVEKVFTNKNKILVDFFNLSKIFPESEFIKDHKNYFISDKEVIVLEPVNGLVIIKRLGWLT